MLGSLILYLKGMRIMMFQLFGFYYKMCVLNPLGRQEAVQGLGFREKPELFEQKPRHRDLTPKHPKP